MILKKLKQITVIFLIVMIILISVGEQCVRADVSSGTFSYKTEDIEAALEFYYNEKEINKTEDEIYKLASEISTQCGTEFVNQDANNPTPDEDILKAILMKNHGFEEADANTFIDIINSENLNTERKR